MYFARFASGSNAFRNFSLVNPLKSKTHMLVSNAQWQLLVSGVRWGDLLAASHSWCPSLRLTTVGLWQNCPESCFVTNGLASFPEPELRGGLFSWVFIHCITVVLELNRYRISLGPFRFWAPSFAGMGDCAWWWAALEISALSSLRPGTGMQASIPIPVPTTSLTPPCRVLTSCWWCIFRPQVWDAYVGPRG